MNDVFLVCPFVCVFACQPGYLLAYFTDWLSDICAVTTSSLLIKTTRCNRNFVVKLLHCKVISFFYFQHILNNSVEYVYVYRLVCLEFGTRISRNWTMFVAHKQMWKKTNEMSENKQHTQKKLKQRNEKKDWKHRFSSYIVCEIENESLCVSDFGIVPWANILSSHCIVLYRVLLCCAAIYLNILWIVFCFQQSQIAFI